MYAQYFGLQENPFTITPNPRYLYLGARHAEALAHLLYGVTESGGFIQLTGEVGTGKTMLIRSLLEQLPEHVDVALIFNPQMTLIEFLRAICSELGVDVADGQSAADITATLNRHLLQAHADGRRVVLIIDEAQGLPRDLLEQVRLLTNLETRQHKLMQIILVGQPELREMLARRDLRQLAQRITGRYHLMPLDATATRAYVQHRLQIAGAGGAIFTAGGLRRLYRLSGGVPRLINILADRALLGAYAAERRECDAGLVRQAAGEVLDPPPPKPRLRLAAATLAVAAVALAGALAWNWQIAGADPVNAQAAKPVSAAAIEAAADAPEDPLAGWLQSAGAAAGTDSAFNTLFSLWGATYAPESATSACSQAQAAGLRCLYQQGSWRVLASYNRPAIVNLTTADGHRYQAVVTALGDGAVTLRAGTLSKTLPLGAVRRDWNGEFLLLWRPPPDSEGLLHEGMAGPAVAWLGNQLAKLDSGLASIAGATAYDATIAGAVRRFQRLHDLRVDGIAGERTLIELNSVLQSANVPQLRKGTS
ncbi:MAG TPA: AAA family ATPase [Gammaproteobacteria bacterium]|nr:AAA family ATPase [Gammaproteobacteria bacterium]